MGKKIKSRRILEREIEQLKRENKELKNMIQRPPVFKIEDKKVVKLCVEYMRDVFTNIPEEVIKRHLSKKLSEETEKYMNFEKNGFFYRATLDVVKKE